MVKRIKISASSCTDMINAFNERIQELDPSQIEGSEDITAGSGKVRIARYNEVDNGHRLYRWDNIDESDAEEQARLKSLKDPESIYYVHRDDVMNPSTGISWQNGKSYDESDVIYDNGRCILREGATPIQSAENQTYVSGSTIDDQYIDDLMQYVADETSIDPYNAVCTWTVYPDSIIFILTSLYQDSIEEYTCPREDLTGDIDQDVQYILDSISY